MPTGAAATDPVVQDADAMSPPVPNQPSGADDDHTDLECDAPPVPPACGKCGGAHASDQCPHYQNDRENHKDAQENLGRGHPARARASTGDYFLLPCASARVVRQPGDGSCLYHALLYGLDNNYKASAETALMLRHELASFLLDNSHLTQSGDTLREWVEWEDPSVSLERYVRRQAELGWGGAIEIVCCALSKGVNVHGYEKTMALTVSNASPATTTPMLRTLFTCYG